jgi:16S rRNA C1402 N4-methylase RsmH
LLIVCLLIAERAGDIILIREATMNQRMAFDEALDAAEKLDVEDQAELAALLKRRLAERGRENVAATVEQARREFATGQCQPMTSAELVREAQS